MVVCFEMCAYMLHNGVHFCHGACTEIATCQQLHDGRDHVILQLCEHGEMLCGEWVRPHQRVHGGSEHERTRHVPGANDTCLKHGAW